ncbi:glycogen debranching enzyme [Sarcoptes scabiei]|nr:glycogen debranching enzyme [Sarcoptes scabiei]
MDSIQVIQCVTLCLRRIVTSPEQLSQIPSFESINPNMNMSIKYKLANQLSDCIKEIGYKSDISYQTFLYSNEYEVRRLFLFLTERISIENDEKLIQNKQDWIDNGDILSKLKNCKLNRVWIPPSSSFRFELFNKIDEEFKYHPESDFHDQYSTAVDHDITYLKSDYNLSIHNLLSAEKNYEGPEKIFIESKSLSKESPLLPKRVIDILEWNNHFWKESSLDMIDEPLTNEKLSNTYLCLKIKKHNFSEFKQDFHVQPSILNKNIQPEISYFKNDDQNVKIDHIESHLEQNIAELTAKLIDCDEKIEYLQKNQSELENLENEYEEKYKNFEASIKSKEELESNVKNLKYSIEEIAEAWDQMQSELLNELQAKKLENIVQNEEQGQKLYQIKSLKKSIAQKIKEIQSKEKSIEEYEAKIPEVWPPNRSSYTRRIIEIIQNIKKQNDDTKKVMIETKTIQKDINSLNGKIERSLTVADEVLCCDVKQNEWNRKCYQNLQLLRSSFTELLKAISEIGFNLREVRKLEEMIKVENQRKTSANLIRINADLEEIRNENDQLRTKLNGYEKKDHI